MAKLVECVPNFSVSKEQDPVVFQQIVDVANSVPGCTVLDVQTDGDHNRCVFTMVGSPAAIEEVSFQMTKKATELIDMTKHKGQHPRMGATDVIPFIPTMDVTIEECVEISKKVAERIWNELKVPSYLYEESASRPERKNLAACRKGQFEGAPAHVLEPDWAPDYGERAIHPTAGMIAIGARIPLIAYNINLDTPDLEVAKKIANAIRAAKGGFAACKAIGIMLEERNVAQVSMNLVNTDVTPIYYVFEMVKALADRYGARIIGSELVGLTPGKALLDCAEFYLKLENFNYRTQVMEYNLL
jgi:glutamate formiminotransferase